VTSPASELLEVDGARLLSRLKELAAVSAPGPGVTRLAYSAQDEAGRALVGGWLREAGLSVRVDAAGNLLGTLPGSAGLPRPLLTGSHLDTVVAGGPLDGAYGVVAAVEVAASLRGRLRHDLVVAAWSNEEGARSTPGMVGSRAAAGAVEPALLDRPDDDGVPLRARLGADVLTARLGPVEAYLELHIEQGPVLDAAGTVVGAVEGITGQLVGIIDVRGTANHAGTTSMALRHDALAAAAEVVLAIERLALDDAVRVATCGHVEAAPNVRNVIPGRVLLSVDLRDMSDARSEAAWAAVAAAVAAVDGRRGTRSQLRVVSRVAAVDCDSRLVALVERAAAARGLAALRLPSGAGHDAQVLARLGPVGMVFVPSVAGVSHSPAERTEPAHLIAGAQVLLDVVAAADDQPGR
jgi:N-carbamoyl-L-amino-acid hydrolase